MRKGKKVAKVNVKRLAIAIIVLVIIVVAIVMIVKNIKKNPDDIDIKDSGITLDGSTPGIEGGSMTNSQEIEYDGNPYNVPQDYTKTVNEFVGETGEALDSETLSTVKQNIIEKFKQGYSEKYGINVDMSNVRIIYNQGTTTIAGNTCLVFVVYEEKDGDLTFISKFAMSINTEVLYKYNSETFMYSMIEK